MAPNPQTLSGGSLLLAWQLKGKRVLIIGGGDVASGRIESVLVADALITLIAPRRGLHPLTKKFIDNCSDRITYRDRGFAGVSDLQKIDMVLTAIDNVDKSREISQLCREMKIPVNVADIPALCDFYFGSQIRSGPLQVMISTNGQSPKLANIIRKKIETVIPECAAEAIEKVGELRSKLRERAPGVGGDLSKQRMRWMVDICSSWDMEELSQLDHEMMTKLLEDGWEKNKVLRPEEVSPSLKIEGKNGGSPKVSSLVLPAAVSFVAGAACTAAFLLLHNPVVRK
ncbi:hypothetical protein NLI96_g7183 [Meripilus lineatus]|uniref:precorrin-2 dehydrogenase n=1 Tax=Meripilus lineatus TaxID=2056292 RepID=A0AAD5UZV9_9APHY|nr:hypothetical protein NLI96_g7183 [Physisporinus lineatus]